MADSLGTGTIQNLGADWLLVDNTGSYHPDTRYGFTTDDGALIYVRSQGVVGASTGGQLHLHFFFETGAPQYAYLNNKIGVGLGTSLGLTALKIDVWVF